MIVPILLGLFYAIVPMPVFADNVLARCIACGVTVTLYLIALKKGWLVEIR